jgi:hypothetical protein
VTLCFLGSGAGPRALAKEIAVPDEPTLEEILRLTPHRRQALVPGERLVFSVRYGPIRAGEGVLEVRDVVQLPEGPAYRLVSTARSNKVFSSVYPVNDFVQSLMDTTWLVSRRFEKHLREGRYRADVRVVMDQARHRAYYDDGRVFDMPPRAQDILSAFFFVRTMAFDVGDTIRFQGHVDRKNYPIVVVVHRRETVEVPAGRFRCLVLEPRVAAEGLFKRKGRLWIWVTDDERKIPVLMKSEIPVGSIDALLVRMEGR